MIEFKDNPIAGIEVNGEENLERKQMIQIIAQLIK